MPAYTKLFSSILDSSVWMESDQTRLVWITLLAMSDQFGEVQASVPGLARRAGVSLDAATDAIDRLSSPDPHSRTPDHEGRRIAKIDGGWEILNHAKYRRMASLDERKEKAAIRQARFRKRHCENGQEVTQSNAGVTLGNAEVTPSNAPAPDSNASVTHLPDKQKQKQKQKQRREEQPSVVVDDDDNEEPAAQPKKSRQKPVTEEFIAKAEANPAFGGVNVRMEYAKCELWCSAKGVRLNQQRLTNWLIKSTERPAHRPTQGSIPFEDEGHRVARLAAMPERKPLNRPGIDD